MTTLSQVMFGSVMLAYCGLVHVVVVAWSIPLFQRLAGVERIVRHPIRRTIVFLCTTILVLLLAHTIQIWSWSMMFLLFGAFESGPNSFYFSVVTYTTLGYGDIVLGDGIKIFGTFAAIAGLLAFGISTAFLLSVLVKLLPNVFGSGGDRD